MNRDYLQEALQHLMVVIGMVGKHMMTMEIKFLTRTYAIPTH